MGLDLVAQGGAGSWRGRHGGVGWWWCGQANRRRGGATTTSGQSHAGVVLPSPDPPVEHGGRLVGGSCWSALRGEAGEPPLIQIRGDSERETRVLRERQREAVGGVGR